MEKITSNLIDVLKELNSVEEVGEAVLQKQKQLKDILRHKHYNFSDWDEELELKLEYKSEDVPLEHAYQEANHIRLGLSGRWIHMIGEEERYGTIENGVKEVIKNTEYQNPFN